MTCFVPFTWDTAQIQVNAQPLPLPSVAVGCRNQTDTNIIVKGYTFVNGMQRSGPIMQIQRSGGRSFESGVPVGIRYYTVYDANQPTKVLLRDHPIPIQNRDILIDIVPVPGNPNRVLILPAGGG